MKLCKDLPVNIFKSIEEIFYIFCPSENMADCLPTFITLFHMGEGEFSCPRSEIVFFINSVSDAEEPQNFGEFN